jgi:hypothetical protein
MTNAYVRVKWAVSGVPRAVGRPQEVSRLVARRSRAAVGLPQDAARPAAPSLLVAERGDPDRIGRSRESGPCCEPCQQTHRTLSHEMEEH